MKKFLLIFFLGIGVANAQFAYVPLNDSLTILDVDTFDSTGAKTNADATPVCDFYEEATDTAILDDQSMTLRAGHTGEYRLTASILAASGFEVGKWYNIKCRATVDSLSQSLPRGLFKVIPSETSDGTQVVDAASVVPLVDDLETRLTATRAAVLDDLLDGGRLDLIFDAILLDTGTTLDDLVDDLETRLTAARALVLDDLVDGGRLDLIFDGILLDTGTTLDDLVDDLETRLSVARAGFLDNLNIGGLVASAANIGTPVTTLAADIAAIENQTDDIGVNGAGLSAIPQTGWNTETISRNVEYAGYQFAMFNSVTSAPMPGLSVTCRIYKDAVGGNCVNSPTGLGEGIYNITFPIAETSGINLTYIFSAPGADTIVQHFRTQ